LPLQLGGESDCRCSSAAKPFTRAWAAPGPAGASRSPAHGGGLDPLRWTLSQRWVPCLMASSSSPVYPIGSSLAGDAGRQRGLRATAPRHRCRNRGRVGRDPHRL